MWGALISGRSDAGSTLKGTAEPNGAAWRACSLRRQHADDGALADESPYVVFPGSPA
jgi:hypothetical protein